MALINNWPSQVQAAQNLARADVAAALRITDTMLKV
jgi:hypothetical protein